MILIGPRYGFISFFAFVCTLFKFVLAAFQLGPGLFHVPSQLSSSHLVRFLLVVQDHGRGLPVSGLARISTNISSLQPTVDFSSYFIDREQSLLDSKTMSLDNMENSASKRVGDDVENEKRSKKRKRNADTSHEKDGQSQHIHDRRRPSKEGHPQPVQKLVQKSAQHGKSKGKQLSSQIGSKQNAGPSSQLTRVRDALLPIRKALPIWSKASAIRDTLRKSNVLVLTGETGSGKSTQVPQFLVDEPWCTKCIAITQPRRVAATSLARRVAQEMGSPLGNKSPAARVGYAVRFDSSFGPNTKIKYVTDGMLLQEMLGDSSLSQYSAIVVDEVHERSVNVDLILGFLRNMVRNVAKNAGAARKHPLKVVIMSATADVESLVEFFGNSDVETPANASKDLLSESDARAVSTCFVEGRQFPVKTVYLPSPTQDWIESAQKLIFEINFKEALPGDILVFLAGKDNIDELEKLVNDLAKDMDKNLPKVGLSLDIKWCVD